MDASIHFIPRYNLSTLTRWRCDVVMFMILSNKTLMPKAHALKSISTNFFIKIGDIDEVRPQRVEPSQYLILSWYMVFYGIYGNDYQYASIKCL